MNASKNSSRENVDLLIHSGQNHEENWNTHFSSHRTRSHLRLFFLVSTFSWSPRAKKRLNVRSEKNKIRCCWRCSNPGKTTRVESLLMKRKTWMRWENGKHKEKLCMYLKFKFHDCKKFVYIMWPEWCMSLLHIFIVFSEMIQRSPVYRTQ